MMFSGFDAKLDPTLQTNLPLRPGGFRGQHICTVQSKNTTAHATRHKSYKMDYNRVKNLDQFFNYGQYTLTILFVISLEFEHNILQQSL